MPDRTNYPDKEAAALDMVLSRAKGHLPRPTGLREVMETAGFDSHLISRVVWRAFYDLSEGFCPKHRIALDRMDDGRARCRSCGLTFAIGHQEPGHAG